MRWYTLTKHANTSTIPSVKKTVSQTITTDLFDDRRFPLRVLNISSHGPIKLHQHEFEELVIILAGQGEHITGKENYPLETGDVFMIRRGMSHAYANTRDFSLVNILFDPKRLHLPISDLGNIPGYHVLFRIEPRLPPKERTGSRLRLTTAELAEAVKLVAHLTAELTNKAAGYRYMACAHLMNLIGFLSRCYTRTSIRGNQSIMGIGEVLSHIEKNFNQPITVSKLTRIAHMSESSLTRTFKKMMGRTPMEHVIWVRIAKASDMLRQDDTRVTETALRCGFNDSNYFSRQFRRITGNSPRQIKRLAGLTPRVHDPRTRFTPPVHPQ